jgi:hypothetical protein
MLLQGKKLTSSQQVAGYAILTIALVVFCHYLLFISNPQLLLLDNCLCARVAKAKWITSVKRNR